MSCVQDDDFSVPESVGVEENQNLNSLLESIELGSIQEEVCSIFSLLG